MGQDGKMRRERHRCSVAPLSIASIFSHSNFPSLLLRITKFVNPLACDAAALVMVEHAHCVRRRSSRWWAGVVADREQAALCALLTE